MLQLCDIVLKTVLNIRTDHEYWTLIIIDKYSHILYQPNDSVITNL